MMRTITVAICTIIFWLSSCSKTTPSGFWKTFRVEYLKEDISNQGPQGGRRAMYWRARQGAFNSHEVNAYADKNGWKLTDSLEVQVMDMSAWVYNGHPIFPLSHEGFTAKAFNSSVHKDFPRWINAKSKVYMFKTNWEVIEPGTNEGDNLNGFVLLSDDGSEMSVYHIWGE
jgi:hypothetical protein